MAANRSTAVVAPETVFRRLAAASALGVVLIVFAATPRSPLVTTIVVLAAAAALAFQIARMTEPTWPRTILIVLLSSLAAPLGYFFGPNSAYAAVLTILLAITGLVSARQPGLRSRTGWLVLIAICAGQLAVVLLVAFEVLPDDSLSPVNRFGKSPAESIPSHLVLQGVFVSAFLAGRAAQRRYRQLVLDALDATRSTAIREALLDEARADYERALALRAAADATTTEIATGRTPDTGDSLDDTRPSVQRLEHTERVTPPPVGPPPRRVTVVDDGTHGRWSQALQSKLRVQDLFVLGLCLAGVLLAAAFVRQPLPRLFALVGIIAIAGMVAVRAVLLFRAPGSVVAWPYPVIAALSAGPAYGFGLHAGFAAIVAGVLFASRLFRTSQPTLMATRTTLASMWCVCLSHGAVFVAICAGLLPDNSTLPLSVPDAAASAKYFHHAMVQGIYITAYLAGGRIDREFVNAYEVARDAFAAAVRADARLEVARTELDAALATEGLFTGTAIGPYQLGRLLGRGGMGEVYRAERAGVQVALKLVRPDRLGDPNALERFGHEAQLLMHVDSPYCARVIEISGDRAVPYLAMEYVDGPSLSAVLRERGRLEGGELVALVDDLARGLADVHAAGVVHLDLKPSNVLRDSSDKTRWKLVDFGIARMLTDAAHRKVAGTPPYMAPEQALGEPLDTRTDLYSLSLILFRAITGRPAYVGVDATVIARHARTVGPPDPRAVVTLDDDLVLVLRIGLAAAMADRFANTTELRTAFIGALGGRLDPRIRARGKQLTARAPWAPGIALPSAPHEVSLSSRRSS